MNNNRKKKTQTQTPGEERLKSFLDMIAPSVIQFYTDHYICGNTFRSVWALREYPTATDEQAILRHLGEKDGVTLRIYTRQVTPAEEKKIISNAANKNRMKQGNTENLQETVTAASNLQDVTNIIATMHRNREPLLHTAVYLELSAADMDKLKLLQTEVLTELIRSKLNVDKLLLRQKQGFLCVHPAGRNVFLEQFERALPASSVANLFPFNYSGKTDKNGLLTISKLEPGSYYIKETKAPKGYKLNSNVYEIKVTETKGDTNVVVENGEAVSVTEFTASAALLLNGSEVAKTENGENAYPTVTEDALAVFTVKKVWVDNNAKTGRTPVEISLSANGKQIEKFELNDKNGWEKSFELAKYDENGKEIKYTAVEITKVTGYVTGYSSDTFTVYNTLESLKPKTGDDSNLTLWTMLGLSALLCAGGVGILMYKKSRNAG